MTINSPLTTISKITFVSTIILMLAGCASKQNPCEEILEVKQQHQECERLRKTMERTEYPQQALTAKLRYEEACLNLRYYRDEYDTICKKNETPIGAEAKKEQPSKKD
ncbi:hypothetical protein [Aliiglaciecola sp. LCG003]|uniref:hypothetical protein n=1 Tax=Aliiglaciecola sp. LCG003 TaxID=3053655 RepID=UPI0025740F1C|nr:hypothetical protein [Aliiglaciecola sp. LCG003]WJG10997.1 hypothetical protein QR722_08220 [Aliiglaciecola sp. LCG003]